MHQHASCSFVTSHRAKRVQAETSSPSVGWLPSAETKCCFEAKRLAVGHKQLLSIVHLDFDPAQGAGQVSTSVALRSDAEHVQWAFSTTLPQAVSSTSAVKGPETISAIAWFSWPQPASRPQHHTPFSRIATHDQASFSKVGGRTTGLTQYMHILLIGTSTGSLQVCSNAPHELSIGGHDSYCVEHRCHAAISLLSQQLPSTCEAV
jgi:hypothetical protein